MSTTSEYSVLSKAASLLAGRQEYPVATLYLVPTPIGNLADISLRTLYLLALVDRIACEDTRKTQQLLQQYNLPAKPLFSLYQHNEKTATLELLKHLQNGERVAMVSDAGTPAISDPGAQAVQQVAQAGYRVMPLPGPSSMTTLLSAAGITENNILFHGFLPHKAQARQNALKELLQTPYAFVLLEAPHRIKLLCEELVVLAPQRTITLGKELTKQFEQIVTSPATALLQWLEEKEERSRGEFTCIIHPPEASLPDEVADFDEVLTQALQYMPTKEAAQLISSLTGISRNKLYQRALSIKTSD